MNSILNSISQGDLQVQNVPREIPIKENSIIDLLQNLEIESEILEKPCEKEPNFLDLEIEFTKDKLKPSKNENVNTEIDFDILKQCASKYEEDSIILNTGFGVNNDLHFEDKCALPKLQTPLYAENFLREFITEEQKAAARHSLGLYNKDDVVAMSLLTAELEVPTQQQWSEALMYQLRKGDQFFIPYTHFNAIFDSYGNSLNDVLVKLQKEINKQNDELTALKHISKSENITSLGDIQAFLKGFNNGDNLFDIIDDMNQEMLKFDKIGII